MKMLLTIFTVLSFHTSFATTIYHESHLVSKKEISSLHSSVDRILPKFVEFQKTINGDESDSLYLVNGCSKEIISYVKYFDIDGNWAESDFWQLAENQYAYIGETQNEFYYPGAISIDGTLGWGDIPIVFRGQDVYVSEMRITSDDWGDWYHTYTCD